MLRPLLTLTLLAILCFTNRVQADPVRSVVFTQWAKPPKFWEKYIPDNATFSSPRFRIVRDVPSEFRTSLQLDSFTYVFPASASGLHTLRIGVIELSDCEPGTRQVRFIVNGVTSPQEDIAALSGCQTPHYIDIPFPVGGDGLVTITGSTTTSSLPLLISNFRLFMGSASAVTPYPSPSSPTAVSPMPSPSPSSSTSPVDVSIDVGPDTDLPGTLLFEYDESVNPRIDRGRASGIPPFVFRTGREGSAFSFSFELPPGDYDVFLGFVEVRPENCFDGARVFNVLINGFMRLESYDIYKITGGCLRAQRESFFEQTVDPLNPVPMEVSFHGVSGLASLSYIRVRPSRTQCIPAGSIENADQTEDHFAHAVPGRYPSNGETSYTDNAGRGFVSVKLDGSGSHTHYSDPKEGVKGRLRRYRWTLAETGKLLSTEKEFWQRFTLGSTRVRLSVLDNACSKHEADTTVTVTGSVVEGVYCYYYNGLDSMPGANTLHESPSPDISGFSNRPRFQFPNFSFRNNGFVVRCTFFVLFEDDTQDTEVSVITHRSGRALVYNGADLVLDTDTSYRTESLPTALGMVSYEVLYQYTDLSVDPTMVFRINGRVPEKVFYDKAAVRPIITEILPNSGRIEGGSRTTIKGYGLFQPIRVQFGSKSVMSIEDQSSSTTLVVEPPSVGEPQLVDVTVFSNINASSDSLTYEYGTSCDPVRFETLNLKRANGNDFSLDQPTAVVAGPDGKLYIGTRGGVVHVVAYRTSTLEVRSQCHSEVIVDERYIRQDGELSVRSILGLALNPRSKRILLYASVSSLFWERRGEIRRGEPLAWMNGAIVRLQVSSAATRAIDPDQCLEQADNEPYIQNLPVSDGDHSVNDLLFSQDGDLLIAVGGNTNAGLPYASLGGNWETYLGGAVVVAKIRRRRFNGTIDYTTPTNLRTAKPKTKHVDLYATGFRNMFSLTMTRRGRIYGADMGPNCGFGNVSTSCSEYNETAWAERGQLRWGEKFPGDGLVDGEGECMYNDDRDDKLVMVKEGMFYGHPNLQRAALDGTPGECAWIDPLTDKSAKPFQAEPPGNYEAPIARLQSPTTGLVEYGSNLFCGRMRGNLVLSMLQGRNTWRLRLKSDGTADGDRMLLENSGALRVVENVHGDLIFPGYHAGLGLVVLRPVVRDQTGLFIVNALPFRHGKNGGTPIMIGGWGFNARTVVTVGRQPCEITRLRSTEVRCTVPPHSGGALLVNVRIVAGRRSGELEDAVLYMNV